MTTGWTDIAAKGWVRIRVDGHDTIVPPDAGGHFTATVTVELAGTTRDHPATDGRGAVMGRDIQLLIDDIERRRRACEAVMRYGKATPELMAMALDELARIVFECRALEARCALRIRLIDEELMVPAKEKP